MHNIEPEPSRGASRADRRLHLVIGNKTYSSWSMRPWLALTAFDIPFDEVRIGLGQPDTSSRIAQFSPSGRVPVLVDGELTVWDSLAICEYLAEQFPEKEMWPAQRIARARARAICAEMHSGFIGLRSAMWMNLRARFPGKGRTADAQADIARVREIWTDCLEGRGEQDFLFGSFSIADAFYAPVVMRFRTYEVDLPPRLQAYVQCVLAHPAVHRWVQEAEQETDQIPAYDVYPD